MTGKAEVGKCGINTKNSFVMDGLLPGNPGSPDGPGPPNPGSPGAETHQKTIKCK